MAIVEFQGTTYEVPDDMPDDQVRQALMGDKPTEQSTKAEASQVDSQITQKDVDEVPKTEQLTFSKGFDPRLKNNLSVRAGGLFAEGMIKLAGDPDNLLSDARRTEVFERWNPLMQEANDKVLAMSTGDRRKEEYQQAIEERAKIRGNFVDDMNGELVEDSGEPVDWGALIKSAGENKMYTLGALASAIVESPEVMAVGSGVKLGATFLKASKSIKAIQASAKAKVAVEATGGVVGLSLASGGITAAFSGVEMLEEDGEINFEKLTKDTGLGLAVGAAFAPIPIASSVSKFRGRVKFISEQKALGLVGRQEQKAGIKINEVTSDSLMADIEAMTGIVAKDVAKGEKVIKVKSPTSAVTPTEQAVINQKKINSFFKSEGNQSEINKVFGVEATPIAKGVKPVERTAVNELDAALTKSESVLVSTKAKAKPVKSTIAPQDEAVKLAARTVLKNQAGGLNSKQAITLAAVSGSGLLGFSLEGDIGDAAGAAILAGAGIAGGALLVKGLSKLTSGVRKVMVNQQRNSSMMWFVDGWESLVDGAALETDRFVNKMELMFSKADMELIRKAREGVITAPSKHIAQGDKIVKSFFDSHFKILNENKVINSYLENFIPHLVNTVNKSAKEMSDIKKIVAKGMGTGSTSRHNKQRIYATIEDLEAAGHSVINRDLGAIMRGYSKSVHETLANKLMTDNLKLRNDQFGNKLIVGFDEPVEVVLKSGKTKIKSQRVQAQKGTENDYVEFTHPAFKNKDGSYQRVHREIADSLGLIYDTTLNPSMRFEAVKLLNMTMKRMVVSYSLFHAKALAESLFFATGIKEGGKSMIQLMGEIKKKGSHPVLQQLYYGQRGDWVDQAVKSGLKLSKVEDINSDKFKQLVDVFDKKLEGAGFAGKLASFPTTKLHNFLHKNIDTLMWDKVMTANKLVGYQKNFERAKIRNIKLHQRNPTKVPLLSDEVLSQKAAQFTNDAFGGLDWARLAESATTKLGFSAATLISKKKNRGTAQLIAFAPDWTLANLRILGKSIPGFKDMIPLLGKSEDAVLNSLHRDYAIRATLMFLAGQEVISRITTGKQSANVDAIQDVMGVGSFDWERSEDIGYEDLLLADIGEGDRILTSKQYTEVFEWLINPTAVAWNKTASLPKKIISTLLGYDYLNPKNVRFSPNVITDKERKESGLPPALLGVKEYTKSLASAFRPIIVDQALNKDNMLGALLATPKKHIEELE